MADARSCWIELHALLGGEGFDRAVFFQIRFVPILDVVIQREDQLRRSKTFFAPIDLNLLITADVLSCVIT